MWYRADYVATTEAILAAAWIRKHFLLGKLNHYKYRIALVLAIFAIAAIHATGMVEIHFDLDSGLAIRDNFILQIFTDGTIPTILGSVDFAIFAIAGLVLSVALPICNPIGASLLTLLVALVPFLVAYNFPTKPIYIPLEYTLGTILALFLVNVMASYFAQTRERQRLITIFGQYIPPEVVEEISVNPDRFALHGEARELTVFFSDIKDFSTISEQLEPRQLTQLLNTYFTEMTDILHRHGATIDKYIGDAIMAFWGAPLPVDDHAKRALDAAVDMQEALVELRRDFKELGWPEVESGIGINTGLMNVGNMGSQFRIAYTVVGDAVNLGSRIENLTRTYDSDIIVSETTKNAIPGVLFRELDFVRVKGKGIATRIFEPLGPADGADPALKADLEAHTNAMQAYYQRDWQTAWQLFSKLKADGTRADYYSLFLGRITAFERDPPAADWEGITNYHVK